MLTHTNFKRFRMSAFASLVLLLPFWAAAQTQEDCQAKLPQAEVAFTDARFDDAIKLLTDCLDKGGFTDSADKQRAYRLLGLAYLAKDYIEQAKSAINKLLDLMPVYEPDPDQDPPAFIQIFETVKRERERLQSGAQPPPKEVKPEKERKGGSGKWFLIGGGVIVLGAGAALALGGGGGDGGPVIPPPNPLPDPPPLP